METKTMKLKLLYILNDCVSETEKNKIIKWVEESLIKEALQVQDACNLSGIVHSFSDGMSILWDIANATGKGTDWVNRHRYSRLFADKIKSLSGDIENGDFDSLEE